MKKYANEKPPLRAELFSADRMEQYAQSLALEHKVSSGMVPDQLLKRLADNEDVLIEVHDLLTETIKAKRQITPAGEWMLDNFYLIEDHIRTGKRHLPKGYSQALPWLAKGDSKGLPRVYDIALEIISHSDGRVDANGLINFIAAYQKNTALQLGELWAIPIMLRLALIENLRRVAARIAIGRINRNLAHYWADQMNDIVDKDPKSLVLVIADMARSDPPMESSFVAELTRRLQGKGPALALPLSWMEQRLAELGFTGSEIVNQETQKQAADQVSMSNSIGSLRFLATMDWRDFVEQLSVVEKTLRSDPSGTYGGMDFQTRDVYRHVVEKMAKQSERSEAEVAQIAVDLAREHQQKNRTDNRRAHVGFYLVDKGKQACEINVRMQFKPLEQIRRFFGRFPVFNFSFAIIILTGFFTLVMMAQVGPRIQNIYLLICVGILAVIGASQLAVGLVNWISTVIVNPTLLPKMDFDEGIPEDDRTMVVVPTILSGVDEVEKLIEDLEVRYLGNKDDHLHFALLTDFRDAKEEEMPTDAALVLQAKTSIEELNRKYGHQENDIFFLFHRPRKWNPHDKVWMGFERKRGKLTELNAVLRGGPTNNFSMIVGEPSVYTRVRYVITLDTDTQLPRDAACRLVATITHPLNRATYDQKKKLVTEGYGILQPRVAISLSGSTRTLYAKMHSNDSGIDPYTRAVSDVYQDLFGEGSFIGKGIYEVETFESALNNRFPDNRILSHDLLEGCYARSGMVSDIELFEEYPSRYSVDVSRRHRWIRGDWQIGGWMMPFAPGNNRRLHANPLSALSRWKIFDNLRRSLVPVALTALLILGWTVFSASWFWTFAVIIIVILPSVVNTAWGIVNKPDEFLLWQHVQLSAKSAYNSFFQSLFIIVCLPFDAYFHLDAIVRTNWRMIFTGKKLLEWNPSGSLEKTNHKDLPGTYFTMWVAPLLALAVFVVLVREAPLNLLLAMPFLGLWALSPAIAWYISIPLNKNESKLNADQRLFLQKLARRTWWFFERFVGPSENWLPPDNFQEHPVAVIAHRTSPTNIGLSLLANLTANEFGYISTGKLIERSANTINSMEMLERFHGHFYNWYDTESLTVLPPRYISTVDSGNLAGHLLTLRQGLIALPEQPIVPARFIEGLRTTYLMLVDSAGTGKFPALNDFDKTLDTVALNEDTDLPAFKIALDKLAEIAARLKNETGAGEEWSDWSTALHVQITDVQEEFNVLAPWLNLDPVPEAFQHVALPRVMPHLINIRNLEKELLPAITSLRANEIDHPQAEWLENFEICLIEGAAAARDRLRKIRQLCAQCEELSDMEYDFLYDKIKHLLAIGYNVDEHRRDAGFYDLLASEARLGVFVAIAQGKLPQEAWFALGRLLTSSGGEPVLLSWSGSIFEYLMPLLVMPTYENTLLDQTNKATVQSQIEYGRQREVPWGVSESGYNMVDANFNYQYRAFGVPGLGLKRGLGSDLVIAPYASMMAVMVSPEAATQNLQRLYKEGFEGRYGMYEAIDYTVSRLPRGQTYATVRSYMVHHQGMGFLALAYQLLNQPMQKFFATEPQFQATLLLLQERIPKVMSFYSRATDVEESNEQPANTEIRLINNPNTVVPEVQLLSNGRYHVMVTNSGGGYSRWKDIAITRWREDTTCDNWGTFCYIREENAPFWSIAHQPSMRSYKNYEVVFSQGHAEYRMRDKNFETRTEIVVSPEDDIEMRRVRISNRSRSQKVIEITSYAEVVLATPAADNAHPAFSKLFVQTEIVDRHNAILCTRRPRSVDEQAPWMFHLMKAHGVKIEKVSYETDRMKFIGRGNTAANPTALEKFAPLSNTEGSVLDPIVAIRYRIVIESDETAILDLVFGVGETKEICQGLMEKYQDRVLADRAIELAWTHNQVVLRQINARESDAQLYGRLASSIIYVNPLLRADPAIVIRNRRGQSALWSYSISGDLPILLLQIADPQNIAIVKQLVQAHAYWRLKGLAVDLVIWNEDQGGYRQLLQDQILGLITSVGNNFTDRPGGIFVRHAEQISMEDRILLQTVARVVITDSKGTLADQVNLRRPVKLMVPTLVATLQNSPLMASPPPAAKQDLRFFNGLGGFVPDGKEYRIVVNRNQMTPAPWVNIIANPNFGTVLTEGGQSYTWTENAHEYRLTPWNNDPVSDTGGEVFYVRDEQTGRYFTPTPLPIRSTGEYTIRHGFGYSVFEYTEEGINTELVIYVDLEKSIKFSVLTVSNNSGRPRKLSATGYAELVLGDARTKSVMHIITETDTDTNALFARNPYNTGFPDHVAFFDVDDMARTFTGDRIEFIGRNGSLKKPDAMGRAKLSGRTGASLDPCAAIQITFDLDHEQSKIMVFRLGAGKNSFETRELVKHFKGIEAAEQSLQRVHEYWNKALGAVQVSTPDDKLNYLANGWLLYQTIACRIWGRSGFYQSGGAFGFRDQLQDTMAVLHTEPKIARDQILLCASRQFREGDVQHWWHPPTGRGVRTRISDDFLWLPFVTSRYVITTGDTGILSEEVHFLDGRQLNHDEESYYDLPHAFG